MEDIASYRDGIRIPAQKPKKDHCGFNYRYTFAAFYLSACTPFRQCPGVQLTRAPRHCHTYPQATEMATIGATSNALAAGAPGIWLG